MTTAGTPEHPPIAPPIALGPAIACWAAAWVIGSGVMGAVAVALIGGDLGGDLTIPELAVAAVVGWIAFIGGMRIVSDRYGSGSMRHDYGIDVEGVDMLGIPLGIAGQLALVPALYIPLRGIWPETFDTARLEERARDLADRAEGGGVVLLVLVVVVGAPIVEELVYRGMLQRSLGAATRPLVGLILASVWFSLIHLAPIEYPGLALAGVLFGATVWWTDRLGAAILTHAAFNATGLALVLW